MLKNWEETYETMPSKYSKDEIKGIAVNCLSLSETWFDRREPRVKESYELLLFNKDNIVTETLHGATREVLPETMLKIVTNSDIVYSKIALSAFHFDNGEKVSEIVGELEIS